MNRFAYLAVLLILLAAPRARSQDAVPDGVLGLTPVGDHSGFVVEVPLAAGQVLRGFRWFHNDELVVFPQVTVVEGAGPQTVDTVTPQASWTAVGGPSQGWASLTLAEGARSADGRVFVVFQLPAYREKLGEGRNGGPGVGYWKQRGGYRAWIGELGGEWYPLASGLTLAFEADIQAVGVAAAPTGGSAMTAQTEAGSEEEVYETRLFAPQPNPTNPSTVFHFTLHRRSPVELAIYNQRGEKVWSLPVGTYSAGPHVVHWNGEDASGSPVASGVYFLRMRADGQSFRQRVTLVR